MNINYPSLNKALNKIHEWSQPERHPMVQMFVTRLGEIAALIIEVASFIFSIIEFAQACGKQLMVSSSQIGNELFPYLRIFQKYAKAANTSEKVLAKAWEIISLIKGLASTLFFGVIFSPEANFKIHLNLNLVKDDLATKTKNTLSAKLEIERKKDETEKTRNTRIEHIKASIEGEVEICRVNTKLAQMLESRE